LPEKVKKAIAGMDNKCYIGIAGFWEIAVKIAVGKLTIKFPFEQFAAYLSDNDIELLPISLEQLLQLLNLDLRHRDPFDRLIIAQAITEHLAIPSWDEHFKHDTERVMQK
jgi:PIN domain nuclease of toxin-antitoxin system